MLRCMYHNKFQSYSTDDIEKFKTYRGFEPILFIKNKLNILYTIIDNIEKELYKMPTNIILKNKPIFDNQKIILENIEYIINSMTENGLVICFKKYIKFNHVKTVLNINTSSEDWNYNADIINKTINKLYQQIQTENKFISLLKKSNTIEQSKTYSFFYISSIIGFICTVSLLYINNIFSKFTS